MTVAAVVVNDGAEAALLDMAGRAAIRRIVDVAWSGGALPIVVVIDDPEGATAAALSGSPALIVSPAHRGGEAPPHAGGEAAPHAGGEAAPHAGGEAAPHAGGDAADYLVGCAAAAGAVRDTSAYLFWPGRMVWVDPETVTSLIEAHGRDHARPVRPTFEGRAGWPVLLPIDRIAELTDTRLADLSSILAIFEAEMALLELGDPGAVHGNELAIDELPAYSGPPQPVGGPPPEWGAAAADTAEPETSI